MSADQEEGVAGRIGRIGVTGSTGRLGGRIARRLAALSVPTRLLVRNPSRVPSLAGAEVVVAEYGDADAVATALSGLDSVLMVSAAEHPERLMQHYAFIDGARRAGVRHVVYTSFVGAAPDAIFTLGRDHWHTEQYLRASGLDFTFLRDSLYADFAPQLVGSDGVLRGPAGDGAVSLVAQDDIADAAVAVLIDPAAHAAATYPMTGPEALTLTEVAALLSQVTGQNVRYHDETLEEAYTSRAQYGAPAWQVEAWVSTYTAVASGEWALVTDDVPRLTGHPAMTLREVLERAREQSGPPSRSG
jgi:NAD(P)H dehydrogenase (quinone)